MKVKDAANIPIPKLISKVAFKSMPTIASTNNPRIVERMQVIPMFLYFDICISITELRLTVRVNERLLLARAFALGVYSNRLVGFRLYFNVGLFVTALFAKAVPLQMKFTWC